jgi:NDP-sugar pyrophosphorylase family protein
MRTMILAAGLGTRLRPLTDLISKPMAPIVNKPVMEHILELLAVNNCREIVANLHWHAEAITSYFKDGSTWAVNLTYSYEEELLGTAGGVKKVQKFLQDDTFLVISGDALTDIDIADLLKFHKSRDALATLVVTRVDDPSDYGVVLIDENCKIVGFQEKPPRENVLSDMANSGIYVFEPEIFHLIPEDSFYDFGRELFPRLVGMGYPLYGFVNNRYWNDVGSLEQYQQGNFDALSGKVRVNIPGTQVREGIWIGSDSEIQKDVIISPPVCIGSRCTIKKGVRLLGPVIIGNDTVVDERAVLYKGIKWGSGYIGRDASVIGGIVGYSTFIKENSKILENAVVGSGCVIEGGITIHPSVKIMSNQVVENDTT